VTSVGARLALAEPPTWRASAAAYATNCSPSRPSTPLLEAKVLAEDWRIEYNNTVRPHSTLGYLTPTDYAKAWTATPPTGTLIASGPTIEGPVIRDRAPANLVVGSSKGGEATHPWSDDAGGMAFHARPAPKRRRHLI
jgi:hypothetical protein